MKLKKTVLLRYEMARNLRISRNYPRSLFIFTILGPVFNNLTLYFINNNSQGIRTNYNINVYK